jgi:hypothetical protein
MAILEIKRNQITTALTQAKLVEYKKRVAFHEAGHAAGVYLNNKAKCLPAIFFKIIFTEMSGLTKVEIMDGQTFKDHYIAQLKGGRLIEMLPPSLDSLVVKLTENNAAMVQLLADYQAAFEADIVNLLIGPLAEAKHIANQDNELFNLQLMNARALKNYGGEFGLALLTEYLHCFFANHQKETKLEALFIEAFNFINYDANWAAISKLADYIVGSDTTIGYEEIVSMLNTSIAGFKERRTQVRLPRDEWFKATSNHIKSSHAKCMKDLKRPSQAELDTMSPLEKDVLILKLFNLLEELDSY